MTRMVPHGGCAYGIPRKLSTEPFTVPTTLAWSSLTVVEDARTLELSHRDRRVTSDAEKVNMVEEGSATVRGEPVCCP